MMPGFLNWPFVYDEDEEGEILVDEAGIFHFADPCHNWVESPLHLSEVETLRYFKCSEEPGIDKEIDEPSESSIRIYFSAGDIIRIYYNSWRNCVEVLVTLHENETNSELLAHLKERCERKNDLDFSIK